MKGLEIVAVAQVAGVALLVLLVAGLASRLLLRETQQQPAVAGYQIGVALVGPVAAAALSYLLWVVLWLNVAAFAHVVSNLTVAIGLLYGPINAVMIAWLYARKRVGARAWALGSLGWALLLAGYHYASTPHRPTVPPATALPFGLVQADVRNAQLPPAAGFSQPAPVAQAGNLAPGDTPPAFPGGEAGVRDFVRRHLRQPTISPDGPPAALVYVLVTVQADGQLTDIETTAYSAGGHYDAEARRVVELLPCLAPARRAGAPIAVRTELVFSFSAD